MEDTIINEPGSRSNGAAAAVFAVVFLVLFALVLYAMFGYDGSTPKIPNTGAGGGDATTETIPSAGEVTDSVQ